MNNHLRKIVIDLIAIGTVLLTLSCGGGPNSNQQNAENQNANQVSKAGKSDDDEPCELVFDEPERAALETKLGNAIKGKSGKLKKNVDGGGRFKLEFEVINSPGPDNRYYEAIFYGGVGGDDQFEQLMDVLNDFNDKKQCLRRAFFFKGPKRPITAEQRLETFEWTSCDYPKEPCPDGACGPPCERRPPDGNENSNGNSNANRRP